MTRAPCAAAARTCFSMRARFSSRDPPSGHWMAATVSSCAVMPSLPALAA